MKVIQVIPALESGGVERVALEIARFLASEGHASIVVSAGGGMVSRLDESGCRHVQWRLGEKSPFTLRHVRPFRRFLEDERPDILHLHSRMPAWIAWLAWRGMKPDHRPRLVTTVHGAYSINRWSRIMTVGERVIAVSSSISDYIALGYPGVEAKRIRIVHGGVDSKRYPFGYRPPDAWLEKWRADFPEFDGKFLVTLPGRVTRLKGPEDLLRIVEGLRKIKIPAHGLVVGRADQRKQNYVEELRRKAVKLGVADAITFTGERDDMREILAISDVVVSLTQKPEAFGLAVVEALSLGRPVAGYDHGGVAEQLACLFPEGAIPVGDTDAAVEKIVAWLPRPPIPRRDNPFTLESMLRGTMAVYRELLGENR